MRFFAAMILIRSDNQAQDRRSGLWFNNQMGAWFRAQRNTLIYSHKKRATNWQPLIIWLVITDYFNTTFLVMVVPLFTTRTK